MKVVEPDDAADKRAKRSAIFRAAHKRLDPMDGPRALGKKRLALQAQKRRADVANSHVGLLRVTAGRGACVLISADGMLAFAIRRTASGLFVEKRQCPLTGPRTSQAMIFATESVFERWCDLEPTRFNDPLLCDQLRRRGRELFASNG